MRKCALVPAVLSCMAAATFGAADDSTEAEPDERTIILSHPIPVTETEGVIPVFAWTANRILEQGSNTPAEALRQLPSYVGNTATENDSNFGNGSAFVNLFALGPENTLVLINGRRTFAFRDINGLGLSMLSRAEVLIGSGVAPVYGSGAVGGAVNFILLNGPGETPFEGAEIDLLYGNTTDKDARVLQGWVRGGVATKRFAIAAAAEYYDREAIFSRDRDISASSDRRYLGGTNQGSPTFPGRLSFRTNPAVNASNTASILVDPAENSPSGPADYRPYNPGRDALNFRAFTPAIPAFEKYHYYVTARYKVFGEALQLYGDLLYSKRKQHNAIAAVPFTIQTAAANASPFNPFLTAPPGGAPTAFNADDQLRSIAYRPIREAGLRQSLYDHDYWRYVAGFNGNFTLNGSSFVSFFGYDAGVVYERGDYLRIDSGDLRRTPLQAEIAAGNFNPFIGLHAPVSGVATTFTNGVPTGTREYDNVAAASRTGYIGRTFSSSSDFLADAKLFGNLLPNLYQGGIGFNFGYEYRHHRSKDIPDPTQTAGDQLGFTATSPLSYHTEVNSCFGELQIPVVATAQGVPFVRSLELSAAFRFEDFENKDQLTKRTAAYDNNGDFRFSVRYQPAQDVVLRASYSRATRTPEADDLFAPTMRTFPFAFDLLPLPQPQPAEGVLIGGNMGTRPETTDNYSAGIVVAPRVLPGLTITADAYQFFTEDVIVPSSAELGTLLFQQNARAISRGTPADQAPFADRIVREPGTFGTFFLTEIDATTGNFGKRLVNGIDVTAAYELPWTDFGTFTFSLGYNHFLTWKAEAVAGIGSANFTGDYDNGTVAVISSTAEGARLLAPGAIPRHKGFLRGEYEFKRFNFIATTNYISSYLDDPGFILYSEYAPNGERGPERTVSDYITLDLQASYEFIKPDAETVNTGYSKAGSAMQTEVAGVEQSTFLQRMLWGTKIRAGVVNAFDRRPPTVLGTTNDNYDTSLYSIRNRYYYVGLTKTF